MKVEQETKIWHCAAAHYGESLISIVNGALKSFRRVPGLDVLTRIHKADVGAPTFAILDLAIPKTGMPCSDGSFIHVREQLRSHLGLLLPHHLRHSQNRPFLNSDATNLMLKAADQSRWRNRNQCWCR